MSIPQGSHTDWPFPFNRIPRRWTAFEGPPPLKLAGTAPEDSHYDIPPPGTWVLTKPFYLAFTSKGGWHGGIGIRYDYNDLYYNWPRLTLKRVKL